MCGENCKYAGGMPAGMNLHDFANELRAGGGDPQCRPCLAVSDLGFGGTIAAGPYTPQYDACPKSHGVMRLESVQFKAVGITGFYEGGALEGPLYHIHTFVKDKLWEELKFKGPLVGWFNMVRANALPAIEISGGGPEGIGWRPVEQNVIRLTGPRPDFESKRPDNPWLTDSHSRRSLRSLLECSCFAFLVARYRSLLEMR